MKQLPPEFAERTQKLMGKELYSRYVEALRDEPPASIRVNPLKWQTDEGRRVVWCPEGRYLESRPQFTLDPRFHAGAYYVQEASSMFLTHVLRHTVQQPVRMLDLCAAPGGKTTAARTVLPDESLLFCNEPNGKRAQILLENVQKFGHEGIVVTQNWPIDFQRAGMTFDVILADVPCSGEGMFRKDEGAINEWSITNVKMCRQRQREIIRDIWPCLKQGGLIVYSTCTLNTEENEENVEWIASELGAEFIEIPTDKEWNITGSLLNGFHSPVYRFIPGLTEGEGLFMAVLRKTADTPKVKQRDWRKMLKVLAEGIDPPTRKGNSIIPSHAEALSRKLDRNKYPMAELTKEQALAYLRKESITMTTGTPKGYVVVCYDGLPLGFVKNIGTRANNLYPANWKIRLQ